MQLTVSLLILALAAVNAAQVKYTDEYDRINVDQILASERLLDNYFKCLMDKGTCTSEGVQLKSVLVDALETGCSKCTVKQRAGTEKVVRHLIEHRPEQWLELTAKYDPEGIYRDRYEAEAEKQGIDI